MTIQTKLIAAAALRDGDWFYPVEQETQTIVYDEGMRMAIGNARIRKDRGIKVTTDKGVVIYQSTAIVAVEI